MFTRLRIQNFKAWRDTGSLRLAPLTVFFGTNSSGKSSLLQFLQMLSQTVRATDRRRVLNFGGDRNSLLDLGGWRDVVFRREEQRALAFEFEWSLNQQLRASSRKTHHGFEAEVAILGEISPRLMVKYFGHFGRVKQETVEAVGMRYAGEFYEIWKGDKETVFMKTLPPPDRFYSFPFQATALRRRSVYSEFSVFVAELERKIDSFRYLGPMRQRPARWYSWSEAAPEDVGPSGEWVVQALLAARGRRIRQQEGDRWLDYDFEELIALWLQQMGLLKSFEVKRISEHRQEYEVFVQAAGAQDFVNLVDVGFGVSQVLPVLVQLLYAERRSTLLFEQPEIHLHPKAQSELADIFIKALRTHQRTAPREIQILVESHSEHFLRRVQRRIAEEILKPEDVALYFCQPGPEGSTIEELKVDKYGRIANWPKDFFGDALGDTEQQIEVMLARMEQEEKNASK